MSFALLSVALLQLTIAVHQFEHVAGYVDDSCHVCVQLDRVGDAAVDHSTTTSPVATALNGRQARPADFISRTLVRGFDSRAPPGL